MNSLWHHRVSIITGSYGSGKTEVAINLSLAKRSFYGNEAIVSLIDVDIVNLYFRSRDKFEELAKRGIHVIAPAGDLRHADLPALPASISGSLHDTQQQVVLDVGGDPAGATVLGRYQADLPEGSYDMILVVNPYRPYTDNVDAMQRLISAIESKSRLRITALCNNSNLMGFTTPEDLLRGQDLLGELEVRTGLPTAFVSCVPAIAPAVSVMLPNVPVLQLGLYMLPPWATGNNYAGEV
ncbi:MAG: hypothetical protein KGZ50_11275 [Peptococcaceae bacterium]|nr:hypothetical protein [Peptococcaceae bacterium]